MIFSGFLHTLSVTSVMAIQENADSLKAQLDSQRGAVEKLVANTKVRILFLIEIDLFYCSCLDCDA